MINLPYFPNPLELGLALLEGLAPAGTMHGAAEPDVSASRKGRLIDIRAEARPSVDIETAWNVLTDYDRLADFIPDMTSSRVIGIQDRFVIVEQKGQARFGMSALPVEVVLEIEELPCSAVRFRSLASNLGGMEGQWCLAPGKESVSVRYAMRLKPALSISPLIEDAVLRRDVQGRLQGVTREMGRRKAAGLQAGKAGDR